MSAVGESWLLGRRALVETLRTPESTFPTLFIPLFFLVVNVGQAAKIFPGSTTPFLHGQSYAAFQLPVSILLAASFGSAALYLVEDIEGGYFDKLRATPVGRSAIVLGRLMTEAAKGVVVTLIIILIALPFHVRVAAGVFGWLLLVVLAAGWGVVFSGFMQVVAIKTRNAAATQSSSMVFFPLMFLTPNFVPRDLLTPAMKWAATFNPVTYVMEAMRSLILRSSVDWAAVGKGFLVVGVLGALMLIANVRAIRSYD
jgi:ABC-2 type transport system permease protein